MQRTAIGILVAIVVSGCAARHASTFEPVPSHVMVFEMDGAGRITPYSYYLRNRELEPVPERELRASLSAQRASPPQRDAVIAVRGHDKWGNVIFSTSVKVVLMGHTICCPHEDFRIERPVLSIVVPERVRSVSFEGWLPATSVRYEIDYVKTIHVSRHGPAE